MNDLRSVPDSVLQAYLYAVLAWLALMAVLFPLGQLPWVLTLCLPLSMWFTALTAWWGWWLWGEVQVGTLSIDEAGCGVRSVGRILALSGLLPAIVFIVDDPFFETSWAPTAAAAALSGVGWLAAQLATRLRGAFWWTGLLVLISLVLPVNATGAVSLAWWLGWFSATFGAW